MTWLLRRRITRWPGKLAYVAVAYASAFLVAGIMRWVGASELAIGVIVSMFHLVAVLYGARIFRAKDEQPGLPRPWWQMTGRPTLSFRLALGATILSILFLFNAFAASTGALLSLPGASTALTTVPTLIVSGAEFAIYAYLYFNSWSHLRG